MLSLFLSSFLMHHRPLLFLDTSSLASLANSVHLPPLIVLHHILVRSPLPLPHQQHSWSEPEYVRWVEAHDEQETWALVEKSVKDAKREGRDGWKDIEGLVSQVLREAREEREAEEREREKEKVGGGT
jgi:hypothetical protein